MTTRIAALTDMFTALDRLARDREDDVALVRPSGRSVTFGAFGHAVNAAATRLQDEGMRPGDAVAFSVRPSVESLILILAIARAGGVTVAADPGMGSELFASRMASVRPRFVVAETLLYALSASRMARRVLRTRNLELPQIGRIQGCRFVRVGHRLPGTPPSIDARRLMRPLPGAPGPPVERCAADPVFMVFTSGTTSAPRAVVHTACSIAATLDASHLISNLDAGSTVMTDQLHSALPALLAGARLIIPRIGAGAPEIVRLLHGSKVTHAFFVPSDLHRLVRHCEARSSCLPTTLRQIVLGAGPVDRSLLARLRPLLPEQAQVLSIYGMTEMAPIACVEMEEKLAWRGDGDLVGAPLPGSRVRVDERGEMYVGGERLCRRYLGSEPLAEVATGDLARLEDGRIVLLGRSKDMIIRGHFNIYPALYEGKIAEIPGVARCALVGVWDDRVSDERVVLVVEPAGTDESGLRRRVERTVRSTAIMDTQAIPDEVVVMSLPESGRSHKIDRNALRQFLTESRT